MECEQCTELRSVRRMERHPADQWVAVVESGGPGHELHPYVQRRRRLSIAVRASHRDTTSTAHGNPDGVTRHGCRSGCIDTDLGDGRRDCVYGERRLERSGVDERLVINRHIVDHYRLRTDVHRIGWIGHSIGHRHRRFGVPVGLPERESEHRCERR